MLFFLFWIYAFFKKVVCQFWCGARNDDIENEVGTIPTIPYQLFSTMDENGKDEKITAEYDKETSSLKEFDFGRFNEDELKSAMKRDDESRRKSKRPGHASRPKKRVSIHLDNEDGNGDVESQSQDTNTITESTLASTESSSITSYPINPITYALSAPSYSYEPTNQHRSVGQQKDPRLVKTLMTVLSQGIIITKYNHKGPKQIHMCLVGSELRWRTVKMFAKTGKHVNLHELTLVNWGKQTNTFHMQLSRQAVDDHCFSLIAPLETIDLECKSKVERDALAQGFATLIARRHRPSSSSSSPLSSSSLVHSPATTTGGTGTISSRGDEENHL